MISDTNRYSFFVIGFLFGEKEETLVWGGTSLQLDSDKLQVFAKSAHPERGDEEYEEIANLRSLKMDMEARMKTSMWMNLLLVRLISILLSCLRLWLSEELSVDLGKIGGQIWKVWEAGEVDTSGGIIFL